MLPTKGYAAQSATTPLSDFNFERREPEPHDVLIEILYCETKSSPQETKSSPIDGAWLTVWGKVQW